MRVEANVSLRPRGTEPFGTRVEVKNMNSFRAVERATAFEIERQAAMLDAGRAARPGDPRLVRGARRDVPDAGQGDVGRLPILPGARPSAAPSRRGLARGDPSRSLPELPGGATLALPRRDGAECLRRRRPRRRPGGDGALRGDARRRLRRSSRSLSPTGSPASSCGFATRRERPVWSSRRRSSPRSSVSSPTDPSRGRRAARSSRSTSATGAVGLGHRRVARVPADLRS